MNDELRDLREELLDFADRESGAAGERACLMDRVMLTDRINAAPIGVKLTPDVLDAAAARRAAEAIERLIRQAQQQ